jgi:uncharacterized membrane protein YbhN (UPF0104 family)
MAESSQRARWIWTFARIAITAGAFGLLFAKVDVDAVGDALLKFPPQAALFTIAFFYGSISIGALRWSVILRACGATSTPPLGRLLQLSLVGMFYNSVLPGAVAGDVVRGIATAESFQGRGVTSSLAVTLLERLSGLVGLLVVASVAVFLNPLADLENFRLWGAIGMLATLAGTVGVAYGSKLAPRLPGKLSVLAAKLPEVQRPAGFAVALLLSLGTHLCTISAAHVLVSALHPPVRFLESAVVFPLVTLASYFPFTIGGAGVREMALVGVYGFVGVPKAEALAAALTYTACIYVVAFTGGVLHALKPLK